MSGYQSEQIQAIQGVVDRVSSYQESAPEGTMAGELRSGLSEAGVEVPDEDLDRLAEAIEASEGGPGDVDVAAVLG